MKSNIGKLPISLSKDVFIYEKHKEMIFSRKGKFFRVPKLNAFHFIFNGTSKTLSLIPSNGSVTGEVWGTYRNHIQNVVSGLKNDHKILLELIGLGFKGSLNTNKSITLKIGYSHEIKKSFDHNLNVSFPNQTQILLKSPSIQALKEFASRIYFLRVPDPYKGKGIKFPNKILLRKEGKKKK